MTPNERDMLFGEMSMLWRTNMQQQLLRARRISYAIDVSQLQIPFVIDKTSVQIVRHTTDASETLGASFKYRSTQGVAVQVYWHVHASALAKARLRGELTTGYLC